MDMPGSFLQSTSWSYISSSSSSYPYQAPSKRGGKGKSKGRVQWAPQHTTLYLPSLRGGSNRPPGVVAQETRLHSPFLLQQQISNFFWNSWSAVVYSATNGWEKVSNLPLTLTEATSISEKAFEGNSVVLLDDDYLKVLDIPSTRGIVPGYHLNILQGSISSLILVYIDNNQ